MPDVKSFVKYPGGKAKELDVIRENMPLSIKRYFEPFVGGGSVFFDLGIKNSYINDISEELILLYTFIKDKDPVFLKKLQELNELWKSLNLNSLENLNFSFVFEEYELNQVFDNFKRLEEKRKREMLERHLLNNKQIYKTEEMQQTIIKAAFYYTIRYVYNTEKTKENASDIVRALTYYFLREFSYSSMFRFSSSGNFNIPYGGLSYNNKSFDNKLGLILDYNIEKTKIYNEDYKKFLSRFKFKETDFVFIDPPYDSEFSDYDGNSFDREEQIKLADELSKLSAKVMVVIKKTEFIYNIYSERGFNIKSFGKKYNVNIHNRNKRDVEHLLITNY